jgi:hypothetical protein
MIEQLINDIKNNRCILFLGPNIQTFKENDNKWVSHTELYCSKLQAELETHEVIYDHGACDNPYYMAGKFFDINKEKLSEGKKNEKESEIINLVYQSRDADIYEGLASLPFNTVINFGFDHLLDKTLEKEGFEFESRFYHYRGPEMVSLQVDKDIQLVYNLFGSIKKPKFASSVIKNEKQQLEFLRTINSSPKLPNDLLKRIKEDTTSADGKKSYIFLGFRFAEWPFRFLLDTLEIPKESRCSITPKGSDEIAIMISDFYEDRFGIQFSQESPSAFLDKLVKAYENISTKHKYGYISYHTNDKDDIRDFKTNLMGHKLTLRRNIQFFDRPMIPPDELEEARVKKELQRSTVHIVFVSPESIIDKDFQAEIKATMKRPHYDKVDPITGEIIEKGVLIFVVHLRNCAWKTVFPDLEDRASLILPDKSLALKRAGNPAPSSTDYINILEKINAKLR